MNTKLKNKSGSQFLRFISGGAGKCTTLGILILICVQSSLSGQQEQASKPSWFFGVVPAANFNFYSGSTQELNSDHISPRMFHNGNGLGAYMGGIIEFHPQESRLAVMLQFAYDQRKGSFKEISNPCNCPADLSTELTYLSLEPSLKYMPFKSGLYLFAGPRLAYNYKKSFTYQVQANPAFPDVGPKPAVNGDFSHINQKLVSMQVGTGFDILLSSKRSRTQLVLSPFISYQPYIGQDPRSIESWNLSTVRIGAAFKIGIGRKTQIPKTTSNLEAGVLFSINSPRNITVNRRVRETFPLRNYIFFNLGSTEIPDRYILLKKNQVKDFKEDQLEVFTPKQLTGRSNREMIVYYNVLNILGDRMSKNHKAKIQLTGASMGGLSEGIKMAESVKNYLVEIFEIDSDRITVEGRIKPRIPSEQAGGMHELDLLREGDHRVSISSSSPDMLMEFQSGKDVPLKPIVIEAQQEAPVDSYISFEIDGGIDQFKTWSIDVTDESGVMRNFGPYTQSKISIPGKTFLGTRPEGDFKIKMTGETKSGRTVTKETSEHMVLWTPSDREEGMRFSVLFEFNESKSISIYEKYLTNIVTPKIPIGGTVILHGHTDIIGDKTENLALSMARATDVLQIMEDALAKAGRKDVIFEIYGFGEDVSLAPFDNKYPEERFYNRTVIIDIIPKK